MRTCPQNTQMTQTSFVSARSADWFLGTPHQSVIWSLNDSRSPFTSDSWYISSKTTVARAESSVMRLSAPRLIVVLMSVLPTTGSPVDEISAVVTQAAKGTTVAAEMILTKTPKTRSCEKN